MRLPVIVFVLAAPAVLAACDGSKQADAPKGASFGEILPGSASDAMLPYDTASSTPPLAPDQGPGSGSNARRGAPGDAPTAPAGGGEVVPEVDAT